MNEPIRSLLFALLATLLGTGTALAATDGDWSFSYSGDTATITGYSGSDSVVTVPSTVTRVEEYQEQDDDGDWHTRHRTYYYSVTAVGSNAFKNKTFLTRATIIASLRFIPGEHRANRTRGLFRVFQPRIRGNQRKSRFRRK